MPSSDGEEDDISIRNRRIASPTFVANFFANLERKFSANYLSDEGEEEDNNLVQKRIISSPTKSIQVQEISSAFTTSSKSGKKLDARNIKFKIICYLLLDLNYHLIIIYIQKKIFQHKLWISCLFSAMCFLNRSSTNGCRCYGEET